MIALTTLASACTGDDGHDEEGEPVGPTIIANEPTVTILGEAGGSLGPRLTLSELQADELITEEQMVIDFDDDATELSPERTAELLGPDESPSGDAPAAGEDDQPTWPNLAATIGQPAASREGATIVIPAAGPATATAATNRVGESADAAQQTSRVVGYSPSGDVEVASDVSITFSSAMISPELVGEEADVPVVIEPATAGRWRWIGTRTLRFEPLGSPDRWQDRLPAATSYRVRVPASMTAFTGEPLGIDTEWTFSTPPPRVTEGYGMSLAQDAAPPVSTSPVIALRFNQVVDDAVIADHSTIRSGDTDIAVRPATPNEIENDEDVRAAVAADGPGTVVALVPTEALTPSAEVVLTINPDIGSVEGPLSSSEVQTLYAKSRELPQIAETSCSLDGCSAGTDLVVSLNYQLDTTRVERSELANLISVNPPVEGLDIQIDGAIITLQGDTRASTTYTVTLDASLQDRYGQAFATPLVARFDVTDARPTFDGPRSEMVILDPAAAQPTLAVETVNHDNLSVKVWGVSVRDFATYQELRRQRLGGREVEIPDSWQPLFDDTIAVGGTPNEITTTEIDLDTELDQVGSQLVVSVTPIPEVEPDGADYLTNRPIWSWIQRTSLAVDAIADESTMLIWTSELQTGEPVGGIPVSLIGNQRVATTDEEGLAVVKLTDEPIEGLIANDGKTVTYLPPPTPTSWSTSAQTQESRWELITDQTSYRPGQTVQLTGWLRGLDTDSDLFLDTPDEDGDLGYQLRDRGGRLLTEGTTTTNRLGGFRLDVDIPTDAPDGTATLALQLGDARTELDVYVRSGTDAPFQVEITDGSSTPHLAELPVVLTATVASSDDRPVQDAQIEWAVTEEPADFRPPGHGGYSFGIPTNSASLVGGASAAPSPLSSRPAQKLSGVTDGAGRHDLSILADQLNGRTVWATATASVADGDTQRVARTSRFLIHPSRDHVGIRTAYQFTEPGESVSVDTIVTNSDGELRAGRPVTIELGRVISTWQNGAWARSITDSAVCSTTSPDDDQAAAPCTFAPTTGGEYVITATVSDQLGRQSVTQRSHWVSGALALPSSQVQIETATIVPDRSSYAPGDTARLLIGAPWAPARGVVVLSRYNIEEYIPFETETGSTIVEVPITDRSVPNVTGWVTITGPAPRLDRLGKAIEGETRPAVAAGRINVPVASASRTLEVAVDTDAEVVRPGETEQVEISVVDSDGEPVPDAAVVVVVSEEDAELGEQIGLPDPEGVFYSAYRGTLEGVSSRQFVQLLNTQRVDPAADSSAGGLVPSDNVQPADDTTVGTAVEDTDTAGPDSSPSADVLAVVSEVATTDESGIASLTFRAPVRQVEHTLSAIVVADDQRFGSETTSIDVGQPIEVEVAPPTTVRVGDKIDIPVTVHNRGGTPIDVDIAIAASSDDDTIATGSPIGASVSIPAGATAAVPFVLDATAPGAVEVRAVAAERGSSQTFKASRDLTITEAATTSSSSAIGVLTTESTPSDDDVTATITHPLRWPTGETPTDSAVDITASTSILLYLVDAVGGRSHLLTEDLSLLADQAARVTSIARLDADLDTLTAAGIDTDASVAEARRVLGRLVRAQRDDGGWGATQSSATSDPWTTVAVTAAALRGDDAGWASLDEGGLAAAKTYLATIDEHIPATYTERSQDLTRAYAASTLSRIDPELASQGADELYAARGSEIDADTAALLWPLLTDPANRVAIAERIVAALSSVPGPNGEPRTGFAVRRTDQDAMIGDSQARSDAIVLAQLVTTDQASPAIAQAIDAVLAARTPRGWGSPQANAATVLALAEVADAGLDQPTATRAHADIRTWLDTTPATFASLGPDQPVIDYRFATDAVPADISGVSLASTTATPGANVYYRISITDALTQLDATSESVVVGRSYEAIENPQDVTRDPDGTWRIRRGAPVRVRLQVAITEDRTNVSLLDHLPAGLIATSPSTATPGDGDPIDGDPVDGTVANEAPESSSRWFDHQALTGEGVAVGSHLLGVGTYEYAYLAEATTDGVFTAPPAVLSAQPEQSSNGSSGSARVVVESG